MNKLLKFFYNIFYSLPFGLKGGDNMIFQSKFSSNTDNIVINNAVTNENLGESMLKGEVTQQVEEVRYMDYKVSNESKKYKYIGDGEAIKKDIKPKNINKISFSQENKDICYSVYDELKRVNSYGTESHTLNIIAEEFPKFRLESYCTSFDVNIDKNNISINLHFSKYPDKYQVSSKAFINELEWMLNCGDRSKSNIYKLKQISFVTYKASDEDDLILYNFYNLICSNIVLIEHEFILTYNAEHYVRNNLIDKFYSPTMQEKYDKKERKSDNPTFVMSDRIEHCEVCGKEMNTYDADITRQSIGRAVCVNCLEKELIGEK